MNFKLKQIKLERTKRISPFTRTIINMSSLFYIWTSFFGHFNTFPVNLNNCTFTHQHIEINKSTLYTNMEMICLLTRYLLPLLFDLIIFLPLLKSNWKVLFTTVCLPCIIYSYVFLLFDHNKEVEVRSHTPCNLFQMR